jgi:hypothetical protein
MLHYEPPNPAAISTDYRSVEPEDLSAGVMSCGDTLALERKSELAPLDLAQQSLSVPGL